MQKQCPWHPHSKHTAFECYQLRKSLNAPPLEKGDKKKKKDKDDEDPENKTDASEFPDVSKVVNVIFGGESGFVSKGLRSCTAAR